MIRIATSKDYKSIYEIYIPYIETTAVSFELTSPSLSEYSERIEETLNDFPWLVLDVNRQIAGFAYASRHRKREAYQWSAEVSVYIDRAYHRRHAASALYTSLSGLLEIMGIRMLLAGITLPNEASVRFHESQDFKPIGIYENIGFKFGKWHAVGWWQKPIGNHNEIPQTPIKFSQISTTKKVITILDAGYQQFI